MTIQELESKLTEYIQENDSQFKEIKKLNKVIERLLNQINGLEKDKERLLFQIKIYKELQANDKHKRIQ